MIASPNAQIHTATSYSGFVTEAAALIASAGQDRAFTVSYIDITGFKKFNDHYGFSAGDRLLSDLSAQLKTMRRTVLCSRVFSDHFLRLAQYDPAADTMAQLVENMEQTLCALEDRIARQYPDCSISFSCGYCRIEGGQTGLIQAMDDANLARKEAKALGRTRAVWFDLSLREKLAERERLEVEIRSGLRNEQFSFFLQPKVDLHTGAIVGAEALARWDRPDGKQVLPDQFIPLMEESDLILSLDQLIFRLVCDYLRTRLTQEKPVVPISVNMSRRHLHHADFADILNRLARDRNIPPYLLEIELTETVLLNDPAEAKDAVAKLRAYGYRVSIDDFGSGYTSMNLWRDLDFDVVKLDKSYILDRPDRGEALRNDIVVTSISYISRQFNTPLLCEGPETAEQCAHMEALGCDIAQGYFFSPPVEPARFDLLLEAGSFALPYQSGWDRLPQYSHQEITALQGGREVLDLAGCAMLVIRPDSRRSGAWHWADLNQAAAELYGFPDRDTVLRQNFDPINDFVDPQDLPRVNAPLTAAPTGEPSPVSFRMTSASRTVHYVTGTVRWASSERGGPFCLITLLDDTLRHETLGAKLELADTVEALPTSVFHLTIGPDRVLSFQLLSFRLQNLLRFTPLEYKLLYKAHQEWRLLPEEEREPVERQILSAAREHAPISLVFHAISKHGPLYRLSLLASYLQTDPSGACVYAGTLTDVTPAEERDLPSPFPPPDLWSYDYEVNTLFLPSSEHASGLALEGLNQLSLEDFLARGMIAPEDQGAYLDMYRRIAAGAPVAESQVRARQAGGGYAPFRLTCRPSAWNADGVPVELVGVATPL